MMDEPVYTRQMAVALGYEGESMNAPRVLAKGSGFIAQKILDVAQEQNIPVHKDKNLAHALNQIDVGLEIPEKLYQIIAEIFTYVMQLESGYSVNPPGSYSPDASDESEDSSEA